MRLAVGALDSADGRTGCVAQECMRLCMNQTSKNTSPTIATRIVSAVEMSARLRAKAIAIRVTASISSAVVLLSAFRRKSMQAV